MIEPFKVLHDIFGYKAFRGQQEEIIRHILNDGDALVLMPTGGGKSLCYQIPALCFQGLTVVISPLLALMQDQISALNRLDVKVGTINSSVPYPEIKKTQSDILAGRIKLLYISPEKLNNESMLTLLKQANVSLFAIDEAHCISQWGHDFRPEYTRFSMLEELFPKARRLALTATADEATRKDIVKHLCLKNGRVFVSSFDRPNIEYTVKSKESERKQLWDFISDRHLKESGIVYCISRKKTEEIAGFLKENGVKAYAYHAGLSVEERQQTHALFLKEENVVIVATIAFGMGINKPDVRFVAHLDLPGSLESYYQQTGRAGRDGLIAEAFMIYSGKDIVQQRRFIDESEAPEEQKRLEHRKLNALIGYAESPSCRRRILLEYFGEKSHDTCASCDNCLTPPTVVDMTVNMQKFLSCIHHVSTSRFSFGATHIIDILTGKNTEKIRTLSHNTLSTYAIGQDTSGNIWKTLVKEAVIQKFVTIDDHSALRLTDQAYEFFKTPYPVTIKEETTHRLEKPKKAKPHRNTVVLEESAAELYAVLKDHRRSLAEKENVPPYIIFSNATLVEMATTKPTTLSAMASVNGVGEYKLKTYAATFLDLILAYKE